PTRSASALFQVNRGSSKSPETWSTKTSFSSLRACSAASLGLSKKSMVVPWAVQAAPSVFSAGGALALAAGAGGGWPVRRAGWVPVRPHARAARLASSRPAAVVSRIRRIFTSSSRASTLPPAILDEVSGRGIAISAACYNPLHPAAAVHHDDLPGHVRRRR